MGSTKPQSYRNKGLFSAAEQDIVFSTVFIIPLLILRNSFFWCVSACHFVFQVR